MKRTLLIPLLLAAGVAIAPRAIAHGTQIEYRTTQALEIQASYDTGKPMADAQVVVYAPDNPAEPWLTGTTDEQGRFVFTPDPSMPGQWDVQVRQAGHGDIVSIPLGEPVAEATGAAAGEEVAAAEPVAMVSDSVSGSTALDPLQKAVMAGAVIWGFVGTALFFSARKK
ncbi:MAG: carboxypeptidase-like regulatory domain-containing protein [Synechococcales bacterium]|nr:carboxypeptidase-like regulatory domain-containing protein [Synechococcales bacterium]